MLGAGLGLAWLALGCGGGGGGGNPPPSSNVTITISPSSASMGFGGTEQFTATVTGSTNTGVTWSINPSSTGSVSTSGLYTAPVPQLPATGVPQVVPVFAGHTNSSVNVAVNAVPASTSLTVTATSQADTSKSASATINIDPLSLVAVGTCDTSGNCTGGYVGTSVAPGATATLFLVGDGIGPNDTFAFSGNPADVTIAANSAQFCMTQAQGSIPAQPCVTFDISVSSGAATGPRNIIATSSNGELATFVGGLLIAGP